MGNYKKLGKNVALLTIGNFASKALSFLLVPLYTSVLSTNEYSVADLLTTSVNLILPLFTLLIYEAVMRFALDKEGDKKQVFSVGFYTTLFGAALVFAGVPFLCAFPTLKPYLWLFVLYYVTIAFYNFVLQFVKGIEKVFVYSVAGVINTLVFILCNILFLVVFKAGIKGYVLSFIIGHFVSCLYAVVAGKVWRYLLGFFKTKKEYYNQMYKYSLPMIPNAISWWFSNSSNKYILTYFSGMAVNGIFSVAFKIPSILTIVVNIFISAWQISAIEDFGSEKSKKFFEDIFDKYESLLYIGCAGIIGATTILAKFLFANEFYQAWLYTPVLICAAVFNSLAQFYGSIYTSAKKTKVLFLSTALGAAVNVGMNLLLIPRFSAMGAAIATLLSYIAIWIVRAINSKTILLFNIRHKRNIMVYLIISLEVVLICTQNNPYYIVSILSTVAVCLLCKDGFLSITKSLLRLR